MTTVTVDILNEKALDLLKDLAAMHVIKLHGMEDSAVSPLKSIQNLKGTMKKQPIAEIERQIKEMRDEWN